MRLRTAVLSVLAIALSGCIASVKYPAGWAEIRPSQCAEVSGEYENTGSEHRPTQMWSGPYEIAPSWLAPLFFVGEGRTLSDPRQAVSVRIDARTAGQLAVTALMPDGRTGSAILREDKGEFRCDGGMIELSSTDFGMAFVVVGGAKGYSRLQKAADGALIVAGHWQMIGTAFITVPLYMSQRTYARFGAVPPDAAPPAGAGEGRR